MFKKMWCYQQLLQSSFKSNRFYRSIGFGVAAYFITQLAVVTLLPITLKRVVFVLCISGISLINAYFLIRNRERADALLPVSKKYFVHSIYWLVVGLPIITSILFYTLQLLIYSVLFWISCFFTPDYACLNIMEQSIPENSNGLLAWQGVVLLLLVIVVFIFGNATLSFIKNRYVRIGSILIFNILFFLPFKLIESTKTESDAALWIQALPHAGILLSGGAIVILLFACFCIVLGQKLYLTRSMSN